jgi:phage repressor protein C with HTH and peptisase S24 domain
MAKILEKQTSRTIELAVFNPEHPLKTMDAKNVDWMARIIWASQ